MWPAAARLTVVSHHWTRRSPVPTPTPLRFLRTNVKQRFGFPSGNQLLSTSATISIEPDLVEQAKKLAAEKAVDDFYFPGCRIGVGSGSTIVYAVHRLAQIMRGDTSSSLLSSSPSPTTQEAPATLVCVPTSFQAEELIVKHGLPLSNLSRTPELDIVIDGPDEVDPHLNCIKGGGGCLVQEKIVAACSKTLVLVADYRKDSSVLGSKWTQGVPIEVVPLAYVPVGNRIRKQLGGKCTLRMAGASKAG